MGRKLLLEKAQVENIRQYDVYRNNGGYAALEKAFKMSPADIIEEVKKSGLRGRGGAGFPTGMKWSFLAKPEGVPRYLVCNADESEPGTFKDRYLMEFLPHLLIEGLIVSSFALGSGRTYIYIRGEYAWILDILEQAIAEAKQNGWLGKNILESGFDCEIYVHRGAGAYICGEETALLESLERHGYVSGAAIVDFLSLRLLQTVRHLAAYDLVTFHHRGANYPDALLLDAALKEYLRLLEQHPQIFTADDEVALIRRRALRVGWLIGPADLVQEIDKIRQPFSIPTPSQRAARPCQQRFRGDALNLADVVVDARQDVAERHPRIEPRRQPLQMPIDGEPHVEQDVRRHTRVAKSRECGQRESRNRGEREQGDGRVQRRQVAADQRPVDQRL